MLAKTLLAIVAVAALSAAYFNSGSTITRDDTEELFSKFILENRRSYFSKDEYKLRYNIFKSTLLEIEQMNANPNDEATYGITYMADWTKSEKDQLLGLRNMPLEKPVGVVEDSIVGEEPAERFDWRTSGKVRGVKDQGSCGSCWAFAANAVHEAAWAIFKDTTVPNLAESELVDCANGQYQNLGCSGGWYHWAWDYVKAKGGLNTEAEYPYVPANRACAAKYASRTAKIVSYSTIKATIEDFKLRVMRQPVAIAVDATNWSSYTGGVFSNCGLNVNHAVTIVGYEQDYWIVKNSWGTRWGSDGYINLKIGNTCGTLGYGYYVTV
jgi:C1A family cysteine protease